MGGRGARGMMRGITLTDAEKARVKEIHAKYQTEGKSLREALRPSMEAARTARQKGDTAAARAAFERGKADRDKVQALMVRERAEIRSALTPEHQKQFDANAQEFAKRRAEWDKNGNGGRRGPGGRHGQRAGQGA
jgi:Spy/CpxP family protein refolding chaperone